MFQFITIISVNSTSRHTTCGVAQILSTQVLLIATLPLADSIDATDRSANPHHFMYARALGVYHANVIYTGSGKRDYDNRHLNRTVRSCEPSVVICHVILRLNDPSQGLRRALSPVSIRLRRDKTRRPLPAFGVPTQFAAECIGGKGSNGAFMAHCHRELYHALWAVTLDELLEACVHGIVIHCCDGIRRRFRVYPRIFTYSADYREKYVSSSNICILRLKYTAEFS
jgi:hypothetical protein